MSNENEVLQELLEIETAIFEKLGAVIANPEIEESDVDALSLRYEVCVEAILDYRAKTIHDISLKCEFIFTMIGRAYNEGDLLSAMKQSLLQDFENLALKRN